MPPAVQPKLTVGVVGDRFEQQADRMADRVMRMPDPAAGPCPSCQEAGAREPLDAAAGAANLRRQPVEEEEEELQAKAASGPAPSMSARTDGLIRRVRRSPAQPLPGSLRRFMEPRFGADFGQVRVHSGQAAAEAARAINARAFTVGRDVVFGAGQYAPEAREGRRLLAHELTHVVQQRATSVPSVQRLTETEKAEDLSSEKYADNPRLERAFDNAPPLGVGESREAVRLVQEGLVEDGFAMPVSTRSDGTMDGAFGSETYATVRAFQSDHGLSVDGRVGRETLGKLDELFETRTIPPCSLLQQEAEALDSEKTLFPVKNLSPTLVKAVANVPKTTLFGIGEVIECIEPLTSCPCTCPLPPPSGVTASIGDFCQVQKNATSQDFNGNLFCPDAGDPVRVFGKKPVPFLEVELCKHGNKKVRIQEAFVEDCFPLSTTPKTSLPAPDGSGVTRTDVGVGEEVEFSGNKTGQWTASAGAPTTISNSKKFVWTAPNRANTGVTIELSTGCETDSIVMTVIEPDSITADKLSEIAIPAGTAGAGMKLRFNYHPKTVSFGNVESKEVSGPATKIHGYFAKNFTADDLKHDSKDTFFAIDANNKDTVVDTAKDIRNTKPFEFGTYAWVIKNNFKVQTEPGDGKKFTEVTQFFVMVDDTGKMRITKAGAEVERSP